MNHDGDSNNIKLAELLRHPDDLEKIGSIKRDFQRKKTAVDSQLKLGLKEQLQMTQSGMNSLTEGQRTVNAIKEEMMKIDRLCAEAQQMIRNFPEINAVAQAHRNFTEAEAMKTNIETFNDRLDDLQRLLKADEEDLSTQSNLLQIHYEITRLRDIRDTAIDQVKRADDSSLESTLQDHFKNLDNAIDDFDEHIGFACMNLIPLVQADNTSLVVRLAIIIEEEEKFDERIKELQEAQKEFKDLATRFRSLTTGPKELRGYKEKFLESIKLYAQTQLDKSNEAFMDDPDKLEKSVRWYFNDLNAVKMGMTKLMPKKWKIFTTYVRLYHNLMYEWLKARAEDKATTPTHMLAIVHWKEKYINKMARLGVPTRELEPQLPGGRDSDLVREYRQLIVDSVDQWMANINRTDRQNFSERNETALYLDGHLQTKTLGDMWRMLREQLQVASNSDLTDVTEGVVDAMFRALKGRQDMWDGIVRHELVKYSPPNPVEQEGMHGLHDWLIALANDQIECVHNPDEESGRLGYLSNFRADYEALVSSSYIAESEDKFASIKDGYIDLAIRCISIFTKLIFVTDFRTAMAEFFTPAWYTKTAMGQIMSTYEDYLSDYADRIPELLHDILIEELAKQLLIAYLSCVRNKGAKFRRSDAYQDKMHEDVLIVFKFFEKFEKSFDAIKEQWRVVEGFLGLLDCDKHALGQELAKFMGTYPDVRFSWIESVLRARDDVEFGPLGVGDGKSIMKTLRASATEKRSAPGMETIMSEVS